MKEPTRMGAVRLRMGVTGSRAVHWYSFSLLAIFGALVLGSAGGVGASRSSSSPVVFAEDIHQLAQPAYYVEPQSFHVGSRHLLQTSSTPYLLATNRTDRPNVAKGFKTYRGGYDLKNKNYGYSLGWTGLAAWILTIIWTLLGLLMLLTLCCCCCCCRGRTRHEYDHGRLGYILPVLALILFTLAAIAGSVLLYYYSTKFHNNLQTTLDTVINQADATQQGLRDVQNNLTSATNINIAGFSFDANTRAQIASTNQQLNSSANNLADKTTDTRDKIHNGVNIVRIVLYVVAAVMLALVILGLLFSACGIRPLVYLLILIGWILVIGTWILCGIFMLLDNGVGDTCLAMREWVANPSANTSLNTLLPCDPGAASAALQNSGQYSSQLVTAVNNQIASPINQNPALGSTNPLGYNQSGPAVPTLCNTTTCASNTVTFNTAASVWSGFVCRVSSSNANLCVTQGRLTPTIYNNLVTATGAAGNLTNSGTFLANTANCSFVRDVFTNVTQNQCDPLRHSAKWIWIGLILTSAGTMLSILLWIVFIRRKRYRYYQRQDKQAGMFNGRA